MTTLAPTRKLVLGMPPSHTQQELFESKAFITGFGGARGGGKTWGARTRAVMLAYEYPGIRILIVRQTFPELVKNYISPLRKILFGFAKYNQQDKVFLFPNGSTISFMYCRNDSDLDMLQGAEYDVMIVDEATNLSEYQLRELIAVVRGANSFPKYVIYTCNPGGQSHQYFKRVFIDRAYNENENPQDYKFIQSLVTDNYVLMHYMPRYVQNLDSLPARRKAAWRYGDWDVFEGQYFSEFVDAPEHYDDGLWTHVINPFTPPRSWGDVYRSFDWGFSKPFSVGWWIVEPEIGTVYRMLELYGCVKNEPNVGVQWTTDEIFARVAEIERTNPLLAGRKVWGVADPACWEGSRGGSIIEDAGRYGLHFKKAVNDRIPGWMQMRYRLMFNKHGRPMMQVFKNCTAFRRTIRLMMFDEKRPEDLDSKLEDHVVDDTRYFCMSRPILPHIEDEAAPIFFDPLNQFTRTPLSR